MVSLQFPGCGLPHGHPGQPSLWWLVTDGCWRQPSVSCWLSRVHPGEAPAPTRSCSKLTPFPALDSDLLCSLCLLPPLAPLSLASSGVFCAKVASPVVTTTLPGLEPLHDGPEGEQHGLSPVVL